VQFAFRILGLSARLLLALGIVCILLALYLAWQTQAFSAESVQVMGEVVSYREIPDGDHKRYRPRVRFKTETGEIVTFDGQLSTTTRRFALGAPVPVSYPRTNPTQARVAAFADNWLGALVAGVVALVSLAGGLLIRRAARREAAKP